MAYISFQPSDHFNTKLYTGTGSSLAITGVGFQPDWTFIYNYGGTYASAMYNSMSGVTKHLESNGNSGEQTVANTLTSFDSDGFTLGADTNNYVNRSSSPNSYASWNWKLGTTSGISGGSVTPSGYTLNTTNGTSIVKWSGAGATSTIPHGLGVKPKMIWIKRTDQNGNNWQVYHSGLGAGKKLFLNTYGSEVSSGWMNSTEPTSSVFTVVDDADINASGGTYIAFCFAEVTGFSRISSFVGNGSLWGPVINCGFKPAMVLYKKTTGSVANWQLWDNKRDTHNEAISAIHIDGSAVPSTDKGIDFLANGFKIRGNEAHTNGSGIKFIYYAVAEQPLVSSNGVPALAK